MSRKAALVGNSFMGDTILNLALIRAIQEKEQYDQIIFPIISEMEEPVTEYLLREDDGYIKTYTMDMYLNVICDPSIKPTESYEAGEVRYHYGNVPSAFTNPYSNFSKTIRQFVFLLRNMRVQTVYLTHWTLGFMWLARECESAGIRVQGLHDGPFGGFILHTTWEGLTQIGGVWTPDEFVGDKLSKWFTGKPLEEKYFYVKRPETEPTNDYVLVMPSSRAQLPTVGHWDLDIQILKGMGHKVKMGLWRASPEEYQTYLKAFHLANRGEIPAIMLIEDFGQTIDLIHNAKAVITPDSGQFHVSWIFNKPTMVKLKAGVLYEWYPLDIFHKRKGSQVIGVWPLEMFKAQYAHDFKSAFQFLGVK